MMNQKAKQVDKQSAHDDMAAMPDARSAQLLAAKLAVLRSQRDAVREMLMNAERSQADAQAEANYHIGAMASRYDTFKEEAQYLVDAQKLRVLELSVLLAEYEGLIRDLPKAMHQRVMLGACVILTNEQSPRYFFISPATIGAALVIDGISYHSIAITAPLIRPFVGKALYDYADETAHGLESHYIAALF